MCCAPCCFSRDQVLRWCNRSTAVERFHLAARRRRCRYAVFLVCEDGWHLSVFSCAVGGWGALLCLCSGLSSCGFRSICCGCWYSRACAVSRWRTASAALALLDREDVVAYIKKHAKGVPKGLWVDVDRTLRITIYIVAGISVVMLWAATIALCHRRRLIEADEDAFDSYIGLGGDAEPEAYSRGRRYDRLHSDRKKRARRREYPRHTQRYRSNQTATTDAIGGLEGGQGSGFMDSAMSDSDPSTKVRFRYRARGSD